MRLRHCALEMFVLRLEQPLHRGPVSLGSFMAFAQGVRRVGCLDASPLAFEDSYPLGKHSKRILLGTLKVLCTRCKRLSVRCGAPCASQNNEHACAGQSLSEATRVHGSLDLLGYRRCRSSGFVVTLVCVMLVAVVLMAVVFVAMVLVSHAFVLGLWCLGGVSSHRFHSRAGRCRSSLCDRLCCRCDSQGRLCTHGRCWHGSRHLRSRRHGLNGCSSFDRCSRRCRNLCKSRAAGHSSNSDKGGKSSAFHVECPVSWF